jgi:hypothetical protein
MFEAAFIGVGDSRYRPRVCLALVAAAAGEVYKEEEIPAITAAASEPRIGRPGSP